MTKQGLLGAFESHDFLNGLSERHLMKLASGAQPFTAARGEFIARERELARAFYLIQSGKVEIGRRGIGGRFEPIARLGAGDVVGWSWLLPPHEWQFDCRVVEPVEGLRFDAEWLREQCEADHELGFHLLRHLLAVVAERLAATRRAAGRPLMASHA